VYFVRHSEIYFTAIKRIRVIIIASNKNLPLGSKVNLKTKSTQSFESRSSFEYLSKQSSPATRHGGAWGERYSSYSFFTSALDGGEWSASHPGRVLRPGKGPPVPIVQEAGWAPELVWTQRIEEKSSASAGDRTPIAQSVVRHYTDWATWITTSIPNSIFRGGKSAAGAWRWPLTPIYFSDTLNLCSSFNVRENFTHVDGVRLQSTDHELIPARNASLTAMQGSASVSRPNVRYYPMWKHSSLKRKKINKAVTTIKLPDVCSEAMNHVSLSLTSLPSTCMLCTPSTLQQGRLHPAGINSWSVDSMSLNCSYQRVYYSSPRWYEYGSPVEWYWQGKTEKLRGKNCPSATLSTTNPTWTDRARTRASAVNPVTWAMAQPSHTHIQNNT
jgi:hypothetical protein